MMFGTAKFVVEDRRRVELAETLIARIKSYVFAEYPEKGSPNALGQISEF